MFFDKLNELLNRALKSKNEISKNNSKNELELINEESESFD